MSSGVNNIWFLSNKVGSEDKVFLCKTLKFNALSQRHSWRQFHPLSAAGHPLWRQHGGKPAEYAPEPEDNASYLERTMRR